MIEFYSGTPGSGKSLHAVYCIIDYLESGRDVITNFYFDMSYFSNRIQRGKKLGRLYYVSNSDLTPQLLMYHGMAVNVRGKENQTLVVIDECSVLFNPRSWDSVDRPKWLEFFSQHRKVGYNLILIAQSENQLDRQIRPQMEYETHHRAVKNFKGFGFLLSLIFGGLFIAITEWRENHSVTERKWFTFNKRKASVYNSFALFQNGAEKAVVVPNQSPYLRNQLFVPVRKKKKGGSRRGKLNRRDNKIVAVNMRSAGSKPRNQRKAV